MIAHPEVTVVGLILTTRFRITPRFLRTGCFRESDVFRQLFEGVVVACMAAGLVKGEGFAVDASVMEANASRYHGKAPDEIAWAEPEHQTRAVREYLAGLEAENEPNPDRKPPKVISPSDPCSAWRALMTRSKSTKTILERTERQLNLKPKRLAADTSNGTGRFLGWLVGRGIAPHIPVRDASERDDGTFSRSDFRWNSRRSVYICPNNKVLHSTGTVYDGTLLRYRASKFDCDVCPLKMKCCPNTFPRHVPRDLQEEARDVARRLMGTKRFLKSRDERERLEMRFAHLKIHHGFERMRLEDCPALVTSSISPLSYRTSRPLALRSIGPPVTPQPASVA